MKVLLVDDHPLFREGVALLLQRLQADLEVLHAGSCDEALARLEASGPAALALVDVGLPGLSGLDAIALLHERCPEMPVVVMSSSEDRHTVMRALDRGAMGFIPKTSNADTMIAALRLVLVGGIYLPPVAFLEPTPPGAPHAAESLPNASASRPAGQPALRPSDLGLSPRQSEVLWLILQGKSAKMIARDLGLGTSTVKSHTGAVLRALNVTTRTQAVVAASRLGLRLNSR